MERLLWGVSRAGFSRGVAFLRLDRTVVLGQPPWACRYTPSTLQVERGMQWFTPAPRAGFTLQRSTTLRVISGRRLTDRASDQQCCSPVDDGHQQSVEIAHGRGVYHSAVELSQEFVLRCRHLITGQYTLPGVLHQHQHKRFCHRPFFGFERATVNERALNLVALHHVDVGRICVRRLPRASLAAFNNGRDSRGYLVTVARHAQGPDVGASLRSVKYPFAGFCLSLGSRSVPRYSSRNSSRA
jgi:hypothetical protein